MAICFNMESERRGENFVTRKITKYISELLTELDSYSWEVLNEEERAKCLPYITKLKLGNLKAYRDWTYCPDSADAIFRMGNHDFSTTPHKNWDFVISSGCTHTVEEFLHEAFTLVGLDWHKFVEIDSLLYRPCEVEYLRGDSTNIQKLLGWQVTTSFKDLVKIMVDSDCKKNTTKKF